MKIYFLLFVICLSSITKGQVPQAINYQGVARDALGYPLVNQNINIRLSILNDSINGQAVYIETHSVNTNITGLFNIGIGTGLVVSGTFNSIPWGQGSKWLQIEMDITGGSNYILVGTTQLLSVPYALHSKTSDSVSSFPKTIQERLDAGETPKHIYESGVSKDFLMGKYYAGGRIFYLNLITGNGLVMAAIDQSGGAIWDDGSYTNVSGTMSSLGTGQSNTSLIVSMFGAGNYAAYLCDTLTLNGYNDWYLPSRDELGEMNNILNTPPYPSTPYFWSSTQFEFNQQHGYMLMINNGLNNRFKSDLYGVRAIRAF